MAERSFTIAFVDAETEDGLLHTGALYRPETARDVAVLFIHGSAMNFYHPFLRAIARRLAEEGFPTLTANTRGHDLVSRPVGRQEKVVRLDSIPEVPEPLYGTAFEHLPDVRQDLGAWRAKLVALGFPRLVLMGHSRGAVKVAYYLAHHLADHARDGMGEVLGGVLLSPPWLSYSRFLASSRADLFREDLEAARARISEGRPDALIRVRVPMDYLTTPRAYLDQYGPEERYNVVRLVPKIPVPLLVLSGTKEVAERFAFDGLPEAMAELGRTKQDLRHESVPDGDHLYTGREEVAAGHVVRWLSELALGS